MGAVCKQAAFGTLFIRRRVAGCQRGGLAAAPWQAAGALEQGVSVAGISRMGVGGVRTQPYSREGVVNCVERRQQYLQPYLKRRALSHAWGSSRTPP